ncbi:uncharacterized protein LOC143565124 [Bidens hawaiensis]|uniref:uncharacterized protein LOC143565124 n=1 Tax=Bidens hawaiensis TaxID=980011 RepID=UPI00404A2CE0
MVIGKLVSVEQSAFLTGRNIVDGPLILNELISWLKKNNKRGLLFKVDIEKAYDSESSAGRPAFPIFVLLAMEALTGFMKKITSAGLYEGIACGVGGPVLTHLLYADDVVFVGGGT